MGETVCILSPQIVELTNERAESAERISREIADIERVQSAVMQSNVIFERLFLLSRKLHSCVFLAGDERTAKKSGRICRFGGKGAATQ